MHESEISMTTLRRRAEQKLDTLPGYTPEAMTEGNLLKLLHELEVHKLELEMQNQALRDAHAEISQNLEQLTELYELAPAAYFTLDRQGYVSKANAIARKLLGCPLRVPDNYPLSRAVSPKYLDAYMEFIDRIFMLGRLEHCRLRLMHADGRPPSEVEVEGISDESGRECRLVVTMQQAAQYQY